MNELQQLIDWMKAEKAKATARVIQFEAYQDWVNARPGRGRVEAFAEIIAKAELLLKDTGASTP